MNLRQAAQRALKAMEDGEDRADMIEFSDALIALRAALAEPEQKPVAWRVQRSDGQYELYFLKAAAERAAECYIKRPPVEPLYTAPTPRKPDNDEIAQLKAEARVNGMGGEREARLMAENDQLRHAMEGLTQRCVTDTALIGELVDALRVAVTLNGFREFNDHIPAMKAALARASK